MSATLRIEPRWTDLDPVGHVNNNVFLVYAEEARARYLFSAVPVAVDYIVVVHNAIDYHRPVERSDTVEVSSRITKIGTTSLTSTAVIATTTGEKCATVTTVQVVLREDRSGTRPWSESERATLRRLAGMSEP